MYSKRSQFSPTEVAQSGKIRTSIVQYARWFLEHSQQRREIVRRRFSNAVDREVMTVWAPLVNFDLEVRASIAPIAPLLLEAAAKYVENFRSVD
jgi:hypothetical protein